MYGLLLEAFQFADGADTKPSGRLEAVLASGSKPIAGVIEAQRWFGIGDSRLALRVLDLESLDVLRTAEYEATFGTRLVQSDRPCFPGHFRFEAEQILPGRQAAPVDAGGLMVFAINVHPDVDAELNAWYNEEHIPRFRKVPGCLCARRFAAASGSHRYIAIYHFTSPAVPSSDAWKEAAATPWTSRLLPHFRDPFRLVMQRDPRSA